MNSTPKASALSRRTSLAWKNLTHTLMRTVVSIGGIGFAIVLIFMQLGFLGSVGETATVVYERMPCQILVRSPDYLHVYSPSSLPGELPNLLSSVPEVAKATPLDIGVTEWRTPARGNRPASFRAIAIMGVDLDEPAFNLPELQGQVRAELNRAGSVIIDQDSSKDFGPLNNIAFGPQDVGMTTEVARTNAKVVGTFKMGTGLAANGALLCSRETFDKLTPMPHAGKVSLVLVSLKSPDEVEAGLRAIQRRLRSLGGQASNATAITLTRAKSKEIQRWYWQTPIGLIFWVGVGMALVVGSVISYMILASDVAAHLSEYATLRAMGYSDGYLVKTLLSQSSLLALMAFPPSLLLAMVLYQITSAHTSIPIHMNSFRVFFVLAMAMAMCNAAGVIALRKLLKAEPANLF
ncbi:putative ABC transport system permease protein [Neorhodopirellula lusitana]|uniref:ABC transport system permease protein n=1 Tax=Neorhodopirellula lusitana TaxID=445327 RepID=A0ABY1Q6L6_9BACT|nr:FtsX-like permease family protein [Neorhodopirellula lusitana]SMP61352.1 putative ABC transport system permease protein [Neorhodopirellula lusitana]